MCSDIPKHMMSVGGDTVIRHTVRAFENAESIDSIAVVCSTEYSAEIKRQLSEFSKVKHIVYGGDNRMESAINGFRAVSEYADMVAIHDGARCLVTAEMIDRVVGCAMEFGCATAGTAVTDTVKYTEDGKILKTVPRENLYLAQTPQVFDKELYMRAISSVDTSAHITDDNSLLEKIGVTVRCVDTGKTNIKLTTKDDLLYAEFLFSERGLK